MNTLSSALEEACRSLGVIPPGSQLPLGKWTEADLEGDPHGKGDARIKLFPDGEGGILYNWKTGEQQTFFANGVDRMTPEQKIAHQQEIAAARIRADEDMKLERQHVAKKAQAIWDAAQPATDHPYLTRKGIKASGAKLYGDALAIPLRADGEIQSLQFIAPDGSKKFLTAGRVVGCYFSIGNPKGAAALAICEGFATGASIHEATGHPVAVAFNAGNLGAAAKVMREKFPDIKLILCADDDQHTAGNPGIRKATEAALSVGGLLAVPVFGRDRPEGATDYNDMAALHGLEAVKQSIAQATTPVMGQFQAEAENAPVSDSGDWLEPHPLSVKVEAEPYPVDALPDTIRAAVEEVAGFVKAPVAMVASSALAALSLAAQAHIDAKRADRLQGPVGLFLLTIADSGERKSTCDGFFVSAIRDYQEEQAEAMKPAIKEYQAAFAAWEAERDGILSAIKGAGKSGKATDKLKRDLAELQRDQPEPPRVPRLLFADITPEALGYQLAKGWPAAGIVSSEAGAVFGSHGMSKDSAMRNLALLNQLWDGATVSSERRTVESWTARGARLTVALQVQEPTLREFFTRSGGLARGTGFLARFLVGWPESTQGFRPFSEAPQNWPHLAAFHKRIAAILANPVPMDEEGALSPALLMLAPEAKAAWVEFHDAIERELASGGELYDVRDVASKSADNAARLGALFQIFEHGMGGAVGLECFESASLIAAWHLNESRRFFGELALPAELADAARLDSWLIEHCQRGRTHLVPTREAQRYGPVRDKEKLATALRELEELDRVRVSQEGRRKTIKVNPALIGGAA